MLTWQGNWAAFAPGDTMEFDDPPTNTTPYYIGEQNNGVGGDWKPTVGGICPGPNSPASQGSSCIFPALPNNVTIKGQNYGACHTAGHTGLVNPTILSGINGIFALFQVGGTTGVTISCIEITQPDNCTSAGAGHGPGQCSQSSNYINYAGLMLEYQTGQGPANFTVTDFAVIGLANRGIMGSHLNVASTDTFTASDVYVIGNGQAGWDGDGGGCNNACESVGTVSIDYADIELNGCMVFKPYNFSLPPRENRFDYCYGQNTSGYGDGFVQIAAGDMTMTMNHSKFNYNTQDGFDGAHLSDDPNTHPATNVYNSWAEGNAGQTFKIGAGANSVAINNVSIGNCRVIASPNTALFPANVTGWVTLDGGDTCRAGGDQWSLTLRPNATITIENNTSVGYGTVMWDFTCSLFVTDCNGGMFIFKNNLSKGYPDASNGGQLAAGIYLNTGSARRGQKAAKTQPPILVSNVSIDHNLWDTMKPGTACPNSSVDINGQTVPETNAVCQDPLLVAQTNVDAIDPHLTSGSPAIGAGIAISGITTDHDGNARPNPPALGAFEPGGSGPPTVTLTSIVVTPNPGNLGVAANLNMTCTAHYSDSSLGACVSPVWQTTGAHTSINQSGVVTGTTAGSDTVTASIAPISGTATVTVTASPPTLISITVTPNPGSIAVNANLNMTCTAHYSDSSTGTCASPVWHTTGAHTSINTSSGVVTGTSAGSDTVTATISAISGNATVNVTATPGGQPIVIGGVQITPAASVSLTNPRVVNGHVAFTVSTTTTTTDLATIVYKNANLKYLVCGVVPNGEAVLHGVSWAATGANNTVAITARNGLQPGETLSIHVDCWTT
jgi:hypothetical protein